MTLEQVAVTLNTKLILVYDPQAGGSYDAYFKNTKLRTKTGNKTEPLLGKGKTSQAALRELESNIKNNIVFLFDESDTAEDVPKAYRVLHDLKVIPVV
ncbi:MAG: hypothetical protein KAI43_05710 [Candidatus Aureabacteria bacterium]|nr:hypothetical protein [Candidatus Auribacterota bacterium]